MSRLSSSRTEVAALTRVRKELLLFEIMVCGRVVECFQKRCLISFSVLICSGKIMVGENFVDQSRAHPMSIRCRRSSLSHDAMTFRYKHGRTGERGMDEVTHNGCIRMTFKISTTELGQTAS